jgi:hypothetical protein
MAIRPRVSFIYYLPAATPFDFLHLLKTHTHNVSFPTCRTKHSLLINFVGVSVQSLVNKVAPVSARWRMDALMVCLDRKHFLIAFTTRECSESHGSFMTHVWDKICDFIHYNVCIVCDVSCGKYYMKMTNLTLGERKITFSCSDSCPISSHCD